MNKEILDVLKELGFEYDENDGIDLDATNKYVFTSYIQIRGKNLCH